MINPIVIRGCQIREVTLCNIATEPVCRIQLPEDGTLIVDLREEGADRAGMSPILLAPGYANRNFEPESLPPDEFSKAGFEGTEGWLETEQEKSGRTRAPAKEKGTCS